MKWLWILVCLATAVAEDRTPPVSSLEKQRQSVMRQTSRTQTPGSFFISPWLSSTTSTAVAPTSAAAVQANCEPLAEARLSQLIAAAARTHGVSPQLLRAVIRQESAGRPCAVSPKGAQGLMQLMPSTQQSLGVTDPFDPAANVDGGTRYLADLLKKFKGDLKRTLAAYNAGPQRVEVEGDLPDIPETRAYVSAVVAEVEAQQFPDP